MVWGVFVYCFFKIKNEGFTGPFMFTLVIFLFSTENHIFVSSNYHLSDIFFDLLKFAAEYLVMGGRLVYWLPIYRPEYVFLISGM